MISSRIWRCTVTFLIGTSASTRPSKLRGIQSAELMNTLAWSDGSRLPLPKQTIRPCSRKRPMMLLTRMLSDIPGTPGRRQQIPRTTRSMLTPACEALYNRSMMAGSTSELSLAQICAGFPAQRRVAGEERQVCINLGGIGVVVAGPEMDIGAQFAALAAHHQRHLGVRLQLQKAVHHLDAGALHLMRPADVRLFIKARLQLDHRGDRLAGFGRLDQLLDDRAVFARAVERVLDRDDRRIARRLPEELDDDVEALIGMMDDDVLLPDRGEAIAAVIADALGKARIVRREDEIGALVGDQLRGVVETEYARRREHIGRGGVEVLAQKAPQIRGHPCIDREVDDMAAAAPLQ